MSDERWAIRFLTKRATLWERDYHDQWTEEVFNRHLFTDKDDAWSRLDRARIANPRARNEIRLVRITKRKKLSVEERIAAAVKKERQFLRGLWSSEWSTFGENLSTRISNNTPPGAP